MRLVPTNERLDIFTFSLAKAQAKFPGIDVLAVCQMSNHVHLVVRDKTAELSGFMQYFLGHLAKRINRLDQIRGAVFERRFAEIVILDELAVQSRVAYAVANPVEANLVRSPREWQGLCAYAGRETWRKSVTYFHEGRYQRALAAAGGDTAAVRRTDFCESAMFEMRAVDGEMADAIAAAVKARVTELRAQQRGVVGMEAALKMSPFDRPKWSSRSRMPLCMASTLEGWFDFLGVWRTFVGAFRDASKMFRGGEIAVAFPPGAFRPSTTAG
jgi:putative transposase